MKRILLVLVGGTICTGVNSRGTLSVSGAAGALLKNNFLESDSAFADDVEIELTENMYILSENMTAEKWNSITDTLRAYEDKQYDGIVIAHGTDTLAYTAALLSLVMNRTEIPVFFVSSNAPLNSNRANGNDNFRYAVECICRGIRPNVYVVYRNISDGRMYLHLASRVKQCQNYSEDFFSFGALDITDISDGTFDKYSEALDRLYPPKPLPEIPEINMKRKLCDCVLYIHPYVGINYDAYKYEAFKAVLHGTYHSGTACAEKDGNGSEYGRNSILHMIDVCSEMNIDVYLSPSEPDGEIYDTVRIISEHNGGKIRFLYGTTPEMAYVKLMYAYSVLSGKDEIEKFLSTEFNYEFIDN